MRTHTPASRAAAAPAAPVVQARTATPAADVAPPEHGEPWAGTSLIGVPTHANPVEPAQGFGLPPALRNGLESLSGLAMDDVRVHRDSPEPARLGALAYARGSDIHLGPGQERHLPHEAWHVVQQKQGRVAATAQMKDEALNDDAGLEEEADRMGAMLDRQAPSPDRAMHAGRARADAPLVSRASIGPIVQRRRIPALADLKKNLMEGSGAAKAGTARLLARAWASLTKQQQANIHANQKRLTWTSETELRGVLEASPNEQLFDFAASLLAVDPKLALGDPARMETDPPVYERQYLERRAIILKAKEAFEAIRRGKLDTDIADIFGKENIDSAKNKIYCAEDKLLALEDDNNIKVDNSNWTAETFVGGNTNKDRILLAQGFVKNPTTLSVTILFHECMHAGNPDVIDHGYVGTSGFTQRNTKIKLTNAAHYQVLANRYFGLADGAYAKQSFTPTPDEALSPNAQVKLDATETLRSAWQASTDLLQLFMKAHLAPGNWNAPLKSQIPEAAADATFANTLPYWSKVEMLTLHARLPGISAEAGRAIEPVTLVDIALSEGLARLLWRASEVVPEAAAGLDPPKQPGAGTGSKAASREDRATALVGLALAKVGSDLTGDPLRDARTVAELAKAGREGLSYYLTVRKPDDFH
jgi:hypothetical protein